MVKVTKREAHSRSTFTFPSSALPPGRSSLSYWESKCGEEWVKNGKERES